MTRTAARLAPLVFALAGGPGGCAALADPAADAVPVRRLPDGALACPRTDLKPVPPEFLRAAPVEYRLDAGDVLAVVADEVLTRADQPAPVQADPDPHATRAAVQGVPVPVRDDGTVLLPLLDPIDVRGRTPAEVRELIVDQVVNKKQIVVKGRERVAVDLLRPRRYRVTVVREDTAPAPPACAPAGCAPAGCGKGRGATFTLLLEPGRNDLHHALTLTGGPPGADARNEVAVRRAGCDPAQGPVRVPVRARADCPPAFGPEDVTLYDGDTVHVGARGTEVYYTAGLLGAAEVPLPPDYDLRVVEAVARARGPVAAADGRAGRNGLAAGAGLATVVRRLPNGRQVRIRVDLDEAFRDLRENIIVRPDDVIVLQGRPGEGLARCLDRRCR